MGNKFFAFYIIVLLGSLVLFRCNYNQVENTDKAEEEVGLTLNELQDEKDLFENEWERFRSDAEFNIRVNEKRIEEFNKDIKAASNMFKAEYEEKINLLEEKNLELKKKINEYRYEGTDKWEEFKLGFNSEADLLENAFNNIYAKK